MRKKPPHSDPGRQRGPEKAGTRPPPRRYHGAKPNDAASPGPSFRRPSSQVAVLYGFHAVREALRTGRRKALRLFATPAAAARLEAECAAAGIVPEVVTPDDMNRRLVGEAVHQGVLLEAAPLPALDLDGIESKSGIVLVLDQITDPHNVGAIVRTAAAYGVDALVTTERHSPEFAGTLAKAASGGLEHVAVVSVVNLARALEELGELGYQRIGLDSDGPASLAEAKLERPVALVLGAEDKGLRRLSRENCDLLARLDMPGAIKSLNVSNACAVALALVHSRQPG